MWLIRDSALLNVKIWCEVIPVPHSQLELLSRSPSLLVDNFSSSSRRCVALSVSVPPQLVPGREKTGVPYSTTVGCTVRPTTGCTYYQALVLSVWLKKVSHL